MAIYYVDSNASGTNAGTSWANAAQDLQYLCATIVPTFADGDFIYIAHNHVAGYTAATSCAIQNVALTIVSVNSSTGVYQIGADESHASGTSNYEISGGADSENFVIFAGIKAFAGDDFATSFNGRCFVFVDCEVGGNGGATSITLSQQAKHAFYNCAFKLGGSVRKISLTAGATAYLNGCYAAAGHSKVDNLMNITQRNGTVEVYNCDLDSLINTNGALFENQQGDDGVNIRLGNCKVPSGFSIFDISTTTNAISDPTGSAGTADQYYGSIREHTGLGMAEVDTTQHVVSGAAIPTYDGANEFSIQVDTYAECSNFWPFRCKLAIIPAQDLTTAKTVSIELSGPASLTDSEVWIECVIQDTTDQALGAIQSSQNSDPLSAGTPLIAGSATWVTTTATEYKIEHDLGAQTGISNSNVEVYICVGKSSVAALNVSMPTIAAT